MEKRTSLFLIDPQDVADEKRLAYAQDVFIRRAILGNRLQMCDGPLAEGICTFCQAPTVVTPHPWKEDVLPFSSSFEVLPDLMKYLLCHWSLQDLRLLGDILRLDTPLEVAQDIIHIYQKQHPLGLEGMKKNTLRISSFYRPVNYDGIRCLAQKDAYFVPQQNPLEGQGPFTAQLVLGRITALLLLSSGVRRFGIVDEDDQWVSFAPEHIHLPLGEHPEWKMDWDAAWEAYRHAIEIEDD